jgi:alpha-tubulin suppressor-like RCC1 family protein
MKAMQKASDLYVWGNNANSEIGLADELVEQHRRNYSKCALTKPISHPMFETNLYSASCGNTSTLFISVNREDRSSMVITCGLTSVPKEGEEETEKNLLTMEECCKVLQDIPSIPYRLDFDIPVVKVVCGDLFGGILTAEGQIFTWGYNRYGELGLSD